MSEEAKRLFAKFFRLSSGREPVKEWLLEELSKEDRKNVGTDIARVEYGWPVGMPVCRPIKGYKGLWEVRSKISNMREVRVFFYVANDEMILLHSFIKKTQKAPQQDIELAMARKEEHESYRR